MIPEQFSLARTDFHFRNQRSVYHGKVRDVYDIGNKLIIVTTDRISAFDYILPRAIPYKGQVLNQTAAYFLEAARAICPVWWECAPDPNVSVGKKCSPIPFEIVVRGYLAGHAWRLYSSGKREICGQIMPEQMKEGDRFPEIIITPTTKSSEGHDADISLLDLYNSRVLEKSAVDQMLDFARALFQQGQTMANRQGLILADTKYEFGLFEGQLMLMDEIHTPDSSRYYLLSGYEDRQRKGQNQIQLSKEFVREWLMAHGFQGLDGQIMPEMPDAFVWEVSRRYIELYEKVTGRHFEKPISDAFTTGSASISPIEHRIAENLKDYF